MSAAQGIYLCEREQSSGTAMFFTVIKQKTGKCRQRQRSESPMRVLGSGSLLEHLSGGVLHSSIVPT